MDLRKQALKEMRGIENEVCSADGVLRSLVNLWNYVLSTMGVSKESISKFSIGNRFHVKLRILSPENCKKSLQVKSSSGPDSDKDQMALSRHYSENHGTINKPPLHEAYTVIFVEQPSCHSLDICENKWYHLIDAQINIQVMILPHVK